MLIVWAMLEYSSHMTTATFSLHYVNAKCSIINCLHLMAPLSLFLFLSLKITDRKRRRDTPISKNFMLSVQSLRCSSSAANKKSCSIKLILVVVLLACGSHFSSSKFRTPTNRWGQINRDRTHKYV